MKKIFLGVAFVCAALAFTSCGDTEMCYEITTKYTLLGKEISATSHVKTTKNDIKEAEERAKAALVAAGIDESIISVSSKSVPDSNCE